MTKLLKKLVGKRTILTALSTIGLGTGVLTGYIPPDTATIAVAVILIALGQLLARIGAKNEKQDIIDEIGAKLKQIGKDTLGG